MIIPSKPKSDSPDPSVVYGVYHAHLAAADGSATALGKLDTSLSRAAWSLGLAWLTLACITGWGGPVDWVLSLPPLRSLYGDTAAIGHNSFDTITMTQLVVQTR